MLNIEERECRERERQIKAIREYNTTRKRVFYARLDKFLNIYPYAEDYDICLQKFVDVVSSADANKLNLLIKLFNEENRYWSTYYAFYNCNNSIYKHILTVLTLMHESLIQRIEAFKRVDCSYENKSEEKITSWGKQGEKEVDYVLKWLTDDYFVIEKDCTGKYSDKCILLENEDFIDEKQEYDHIVVGPQGIFLIETKNYSGKLLIDNQGNWMRMKKNEYEWRAEINPLQQVTRHHILIESIVGSDVPIIDVICLSHPDIVMNGVENSQVPIVKKDILGDFIMRYPGNNLDTDDINKLVYIINSHKVHHNALSKNSYVKKKDMKNVINTEYK